MRNFFWFLSLLNLSAEESSSIPSKWVWLILDVLIFVGSEWMGMPSILSSPNESIPMQMALTWGMRKSRSRFATWMDVTDDAAPTTPDMTFRTWVLLQWYSAPTSMLLIEPEKRERERRINIPLIHVGCIFVTLIRMSKNFLHLQSRNFSHFGVSYCELFRFCFCAHCTIRGRR